MEENFQDKIQQLEEQLNQRVLIHQQEITTLRMKYEMLNDENGDQLRCLKEVEECHESEDNEQVYLHTESTQNTVTPK